MKTPTEYIKESFRIYFKKENFVYFAKIMAVLVLASTLLGVISGFIYPSNYLNNGDFSNIPMLVGFVVISVVAFVFGLWSQTTTYLSVLKMGSNEKDVFKMGLKYMVKFFLVTFVVGIIILLGVILLIIPAILFGVWFSFSLWITLDKELGLKEALKQSKELVKGKFWKVLGRSFVFGLFTFLISVLLSLIPYVGQLILSFIAPFFSLPFFLLYRDLSVNN